MSHCSFCSPKLSLNAGHIYQSCSKCSSVPRVCQSSLHGVKPHRYVAKYDGKQVCCYDCYSQKQAYQEKMERANRNKVLEEENEKMRKQLLLLENKMLREALKKLEK